MFTVPCVAPPDTLGFEKAGEGGSKLIPVSHQYSELQSYGDGIPILETISHHSELSMTQACAIKSDFSLISMLLEELLVMILDDVITTGPSLCPHPHTSGGRWLSAPRNLASVSRGWRSIVFACPRLWRHVQITPVQPIDALKEHLHLSSPLDIHLTVHQWPFRNPTTTSGPFSIVALTAQLQSILTPLGREGTTLAPACERIQSITINATECSMFMNFVLQTWTGRGSKFPALCHVTLNGSVCATWSRACFFDGRNAPGLERLELSNVVIAHDAFRLPWGIGLNLTALVWTAPAHKNGSLVVSVSCFHRVVSSFPNLTTLELCEHVVGLEFVTLENLEGGGIAPLTHVRDLRICGRVFPNTWAAYILFYLLPSLRRVAIRGRACSGPPEQRTVTLALQGMISLPRARGLPVVLSKMESLELDCVEGVCTTWKEWCVRQLELLRQWQESMANTGLREGDATKLRTHMIIDGCIV